jgi:ElaB/YqjD/DUF883 family membrane-anchored ribosome-binding protein
MPSKEALRAEVAMLRAELEAMRRTRAAARPAHEPDDDDDDNGEDLGLDDEVRRGLEGQIKEIKRTIEDLTDDARDEIAERPLVSVLAAFALGLVVGRLISR